MKKIKSIRINYIEDNKGKTQVYKLDKLPEEKKDLIYTFCEESSQDDTEIFMPRIKTEPEPHLSLRSILIIGPPKGNEVHFSEKIYKEFKKKDHVVEYLSPNDLNDPEYYKKQKLYSLSKILKKCTIKPELILIEECEFWWDNDVNIPVFYKHREFKRPPTVYHPDVVFFENEDIIDYFKTTMAPLWMSKINHVFVLYPAVDPEQYKPKKKKYKGINALGFREDITGYKVYDFKELANVADLKLLALEAEDLKNNENIRYFDTPITNKDYRKIMPRCEVMFVHISTKQYISRTMLECMACKTIPLINIENEHHLSILEKMGFIQGIYYIANNMIGQLDLETIANSAYDLVLESHTYEKRLEQVIETYTKLGFQPHRYDVICPVYWTNERFKENIQNWFKEIPIRKLYLGINNPDLKIKIKDPRVEIIDQTNFKTLGGCLKELMNRVKTRWFVYVHSDVQLCEGTFNHLEQFICESVGGIESERLYWDGKGSPTYNDTYSKDRAYSGVQLLRKQAIQSLIDRIEDDFLYRNEDMIFQSEIIWNGYRYKKTYAMHVHQQFNPQWTTDYIETHEMQWKGFVKYAQPTELTIKPCLAPLKMLKEKTPLHLVDVIIFGQQHNPNWNEVICEEWDKW